MKMTSIVYACLLTSLPGIALADWATPGVAYRCDQELRHFQVNAIMQTSSPASGGEVRAEPGFKTITMEGVQRTALMNLTCEIQGTQVSATLLRIAPREKGQCGSLGAFNLQQLKAGNVVLAEFEQFNGGCHSDPVLYRVEVFQRSGAFFIKSCRGPWGWDSGFDSGKCEEREIVLSPQKR